MARILIADDISDTAELLRDFFVNAGHEVDMCFNGEEAIQKISAGDYHLVVTDIVMPGRDGLELSAYIREKLPPQKRDTPIIAMSGGSACITAKLALSAAASRNVDVVLEKPFSLEQMKRAVNDLLA